MTARPRHAIMHSYPFRVFLLQSVFHLWKPDSSNYQSRCSTEHTPSIMPTFIQIISSAAHIITNSFKKFKGVRKTSAIAMIVVIVTTSLWAHAAQADGPINLITKALDSAIAESKQVEKKIVDGMTATERAAKIDAYLAKYDLPLAGYGKAFVDAADREGLDWRFVAAKCFIESTCGKFMIKGSYNPLGWGCYSKVKCIHFDSYEQAIDEVTAHLAGNREGTAKYYAGKTLSQKMSSYNSVNPKYQTLVFRTMDKIAAIEAPATLAMK